MLFLKLCDYIMLLWNLIRYFKHAYIIIII